MTATASDSARPEATASMELVAGPPDAAAIERQWNDYATPPTVELRAQ